MLKTHIRYLILNGIICNLRNCKDEDIIRVKILSPLLLTN